MKKSEWIQASIGMLFVLFVIYYKIYDVCSINIANNNHEKSIRFIDYERINIVFSMITHLSYDKENNEFMLSVYNGNYHDFTTAQGLLLNESSSDDYISLKKDLQRAFSTFKIEVKCCSSPIFDVNCSTSENITGSGRGETMTTITFPFGLTVTGMRMKTTYDKEKDNAICFVVLKSQTTRKKDDAYFLSYYEHYHMLQVDLHVFKEYNY